MHRCQTLAVATFLLVAISLPASATTVLRQSVETLAQRSATVVRGRVLRVEGHHPEGAGHPFRIAHVEVLEEVLGEPPRAVDVRLPGGLTRDGLTCIAPGVPSLAAGQEVVLFLEELPREITKRPTQAPPGPWRGPGGSIALPATASAPERQWMPVSLAIGTYRVLRAEGSARVVQDRQARSLHAVGTLSRGTDAPGDAELASFLTRVRRAAQPEGSRVLEREEP